MAKLTLLFCLLWMAVSACAPAYVPGPSPALPPGGFAALAADPEAAKGQEVRLGGAIMSVSLKGGKSFLAVSQQDLDARGRPTGTALGPTFLAESDRFLSPSFYVPQRQVTITGTVAGKMDGHLLIKAREIRLGDYPRWEKYYYPVPREWYDGDPALEYWYTPPYFDPWRGSGGRL